MAKKKSIKDFVGPVAVTPSIRKQSSIDGTRKLDDEGAGLQIDTKYGTLYLDKKKKTLNLILETQKNLLQNIKGYLMIKNLRWEIVLE
jgi:hypothetical protein